MQVLAAFSFRYYCRAYEYNTRSLTLLDTFILLCKPNIENAVAEVQSSSRYEIN